MQGPAFSSEQLLLTTLVVKLAAMAALATMLVRYRRFRHILIFERRGWPDRLIFVSFFGIPLAAGVVARLLLNYRAFDLTLEGSYLAGLIAGPYAGATIGLMVGVPPLFNGEIIALPFAIGCGFAGGGLREFCPKEAIWHFSPFVFTGIHRRLWDMVRRFHVDWQVVLLVAPVGLELLRQVLGLRWSENSRLFYLGPPAGGPSWLWTLLLVLLATILCVATPIKIWNTARIEHRLEEQEKLLLAAKIEALASQINPHFLFNTLASISSLIRTQPDTARMLISKLSGLLRRLMRSTDHFVTLREELESIDEYLDIEVIRFGPQLRVDKQISAEHARRHRAEHDSAAARRELDQAWPGSQGRRRADYDQDDAAKRPYRHRGARRWSRHDAKSGWRARFTAASGSATSTSGCARFTAPATS